MEKKHYVALGVLLVLAGVGAYMYQKKKAGAVATNNMVADNAGQQTGTDPQAVGQLVEAIPLMQGISNDGVATPLAYGSTA